MVKKLTKKEARKLLGQDKGSINLLTVLASLLFNTLIYSGVLLLTLWVFAGIKFVVLYLLK